MFVCPKCGHRLIVSEGSLRCENGHCFDISAKGYVNLVPGQNQKIANYPKSLFESRRAVFAAGCYAPVLDALREILRDAAKGKEQFRVLDAGCGEGYYARTLAEEPGIEVFGMDISRDGIITACCESSKVHWMVADLTHMPLADGTMECVLNVLTSANYSEFARVLSPSGLVVKVIPETGYLCEIRALLQETLSKEEYSNQAVFKLFCANLKEVEEKRVRYEAPVSRELLDHFLHMSPLTFRKDVKSLDLSKITGVTVDLKILWGMRA